MEKYTYLLSALPSQVGSRNAKLLPLVRAGLREGVPADALVEEIVAGSGLPPLSRAEVQHAVDTALRTATEPPPASRPYHARRPAPPPAHGRVRALVESGRAAGVESSATLSALSPVPPPPDDANGRRSALVLFLHALFNPGDFIFAGELSGREVAPAAHVAARLNAEPPDAWPRHIGPNPYTGEAAPRADGAGVSTRCAAAVAARRFALLEFDGMPLPDQCAFWGGAVRTGLPVAAVTYSGGKSLHGLLEVDAPTADAWRATWDKLARLFCSPADPPAERADAACKDAGRLSRLPGARRDRGGPVQRLLFIRPAPLPRAFAWTIADAVPDDPAAVPFDVALDVAGEAVRIMDAEAVPRTPPGLAEDSPAFAVARWRCELADALLRADLPDVREVVSRFPGVRAAWEEANRRPLVPGGADWPPLPSEDFREVAP